MEKSFLILFTLLILSGSFLYFGDVLAKPLKKERWVVYYGDSVPSEEFMPYDWIVFDSQKFPPLRPLMNRKKQLLGYLSIGEIEGSDYDFQKIKEMGLILTENPDWPGSFIVDIRDPRWKSYLIEKRIPTILHKKFDGLMLDTIDSPLHYEVKKGKKLKEVEEAAIDLIRSIKENYPRYTLMLNRGFEILPEVADHIDASLAESLLVNAKATENEKRFFAKEDIESIRRQITAAKKVNQKLKLFSLDYWNPEDHETVRKLYKVQRKRSFIPYIATIDLQSHHPEPKG
jgi:uncharacterized protein (TIGR01370 family)